VKKGWYTNKSLYNNILDEFREFQLVCNYNCVIESVTISIYCMQTPAYISALLQRLNVSFSWMSSAIEYISQSQQATERPPNSIQSRWLALMTLLCWCTIKQPCIQSFPPRRTNPYVVNNLWFRFSSCYACMQSTTRHSTINTVLHIFLPQTCFIEDTMQLQYCLYIPQTSRTIIVTIYKRLSQPLQGGNWCLRRVSFS
jgi:hypothetical protein